MVWTCEFCYLQIMSPTGDLPGDWELVWQSAICPKCLARAKREHPDDWVKVVKCGEYAEGKPDPRAKKAEAPQEPTKGATGFAAIRERIKSRPRGDLR